MSKWQVEMLYGIDFTVNSIEADNAEEAIKQAKIIVESGTTVIPFSNNVNMLNENINENGLKFKNIIAVNKS